MKCLGFFVENTYQADNSKLITNYLFIIYSVLQLENAILAEALKADVSMRQIKLKYRLQLSQYADVALLREKC